MIICEDFEDFLPGEQDFFETLAARLSQADVELVFVGPEQMREINLKTRGKDEATDVLSFPLEAEFSQGLLGSVVINVDLAQALAGQLGHSLRDELALLFIHGLLHLCGYDHESDEGQMREVEAEIIKHFALPPSLIIRSETN